jgi:hypothetical protein
MGKRRLGSQRRSFNRGLASDWRTVLSIQTL